MNSGEKYILTKCGRRQPFAVPDDYFNHLKKNIMTRLHDITPEAYDVAEVRRDIHIIKLRRLRRSIISVAACLCVVFFSLGLLVKSSDKQISVVSETVSQSLYDEPLMTVNDVADYVMIDNDDIYAYVADY